MSSQVPSSTAAGEMTELDRIADRSYKTYKARLKAADRLRARQRAWNASLLALSTATALASIAILSDASIYGTAGPTLLVCVSVSALVTSLAVAGLNYGARSRDMFMSYRRIQRLSAEAEALLDEKLVTPLQVADLSRRYNSLLDDSENHTSADHKLASPEAEVSRWTVLSSQALTAVPYLSLAVPAALLLPIALWVGVVA